MEIPYFFTSFYHGFNSLGLRFGIHHQGAERATLSRDLGLGHGRYPLRRWLCHVFFVVIWLWINTYENTIFSGLFTSINPSYFDVNYRGTIGFDPSPYTFHDSEFWIGTAMLHMWTSIQHWQVSVFHLTKSFSTCWNTIIFKKITSLTHPSQVGVSADLQYFEISNFIKAAGIIMQHPTTVSSKPKGKHGHLHLKIRIQDITMILITWVFQR